MRKERTIVTETIDWQGITLSVAYEAEYLGFTYTSECAVAHLQIESLAPARAPLPITETGYRSHFIHPSAIDEHGGPESYVLAWLDEVSQSPHWKKHQERSRQLQLF